MEDPPVLWWISIAILHYKEWRCHPKRKGSGSNTHQGCSMLAFRKSKPEPHSLRHPPPPFAKMILMETKKLLGCTWDDTIYIDQSFAFTPAYVRPSYTTAQRTADMTRMIQHCLVWLPVKLRLLVPDGSTNVSRACRTDSKRPLGLFKKQGLSVVVWQKKRGAFRHQPSVWGDSLSYLLTPLNILAHWPFQLRHS